jgi:CRISPR type IV-associated protein Csf3
MSSTSSSLIRHIRYGSLPFHACRLVEVTARLRSGAVLPPAGWFPAPLDGILAHAARRRRLGGNYGLVVDHHTEDLPLTSTARPAGEGQPRWKKQRWVWAATCAWWEPTAEEDVRWVHKRAWSIAQSSELGIDAPGTPANPDVGRYKPQRIPQVATIAPTITWWCLGDPDRIRDLLGDVDAIGKKTNAGEGQVAGWDVADIGPPDWWRICWYPDGRIARPFPARHAPILGLEHPEIVTVDAYRPPYWRPPITDTGRRAQVQVIAPTTTRPTPQ